MRIKMYLLLLSCFCINLAQAQLVQDTFFTDKFALEDGVSVTIVYQSFNPKKFNIAYCSNASEKICSINGKIYLGEDGRLPKMVVTTIDVSYQNTTYHLDTSNMYISSSPASSHAIFNGYCYDKTTCSFRARFDQYCVQWGIDYKIAIRELMSNQKDIYMFCRQNPMPVRFD